MRTHGLDHFNMHDYEGMTLAEYRAIRTYGLVNKVDVDALAPDDIHELWGSIEVCASWDEYVNWHIEEFGQSRFDGEDGFTWERYSYNLRNSLEVYELGRGEVAIVFYKGPSTFRLLEAHMTEPTPLENLTADEYAAIAEYCDNESRSIQTLDHAEVRDLLDRLLGVYPSWEEYANDLAEQLLEVRESGSPDDIAARYFDYEKFARDLRHDYYVFELKGEKVAVFDY